MKDLINDDVEEEESDDNDSVSGKRKHDSDIEDDDQLEEDDYDLIEENLGIKVSRKVRCLCTCVYGHIHVCTGN